MPTGRPTSYTKENRNMKHKQIEEANFKAIGIGYNLDVVTGYDQVFYNAGITAIYEDYDLLSVVDRIAIAEVAISRWNKYILEVKRSEEGMDDENR